MVQNIKQTSEGGELERYNAHQIIFHATHDSMRKSITEIEMTQKVAWLSFTAFLIPILIFISKIEVKLQLYSIFKVQIRKGFGI